MKKKRRFTIKTKLLILSMVTIAVAVITLGVFLSISFADAAYQTATNTLKSVSNNAAQALDNSVNSAENSMVLLSSQIGYNKEFANYILTLKDDPTNDSKNHLTDALVGKDRSGDGSTIAGVMDYMVISDPDIESATMYSPIVPENTNIYNRLCYASTKKRPCPYNPNTYQELVNNPGKTIWFFETEDAAHIYVWKALVNFGVDDNYNMQVVGYIEYVFNRAKFLNCLTDTAYQDEGMILIDNKGNSVLSTKSGNKAVDNNVRENLANINDGLVRKNSYTSLRQTVSSKNWTYITYINHKSIDRTIKKSSNLIIIIVVASVIGAALVSYFLAVRELKRIKNLSTAAGAISKGDYDVRLPEVANDEITDMSTSFNVMASKVQESLKELIEQQDSISENFATILSNKSGESGNHVKRVSEYSALLAREMGFDENAIHDIRIASMLHDVGKIMIDENILHKPGRFTDEEYALMQKHVDFGGQLLKGVPGNIMQLGAIIAEYHHERWDGTGYTHHKKGDEIPVEAQITSVADVFDALVSKRCYKGAWTIEEAYNEIVAQSGKQFSPKAVEAFKKCFDGFKQIVEIYKDE